MAKPNLIGGTVSFRRGSTKYASAGNFSYNHGGPKRDSVFDGNDTIGYRESPQESMIEGELTVTSSVDTAEFINLDGETITLTLESGTIVVLRDAWFAGDGTINLNEARFPVKFVGKSLELQR